MIKEERKINSKGWRMKEGLKVSKEMVLQLSFERVKGGEDSNVWNSIPET